MQPPASTASTTPPGWANVTFAPTDSRAVLERWEYSATEGRSTWRTVCVGACNQTLDTRFGYRVAGDGVVTSSWFKLPGSSRDPIKLTADTGSKNVRLAGIISSIVGLGLGTAGFIVIVPSNEEDRSSRSVTGGVLAGAGLVTLFVGLALIGTSGTTLTAEAAPAAGAPPQARLNLPGKLQLSPNGLLFLFSPDLPAMRPVG